MRTRYLYFLYGFVFGCMFPMGAALFELISNQIPFSIQNFIVRHSDNKLLYMIDTAPFFLGVFAYIGGISKEKSETLLRKFKKVTQAVVECNHKLNNDSKIIADTVQSSNEFFKKIGNEINKLSLDGSSYIKNHHELTGMLKDKTNEIFNTTTELFNQNKELKSSSSGINEELEVFIPKIKNLSSYLSKINSVGSEINILALNSGIEAHKLNEESKNFKVIANEIKLLSDKINTMSKTMYKLFEELDRHISNFQELTKVNQHALQNIETISENINSHVDHYKNVIHNVADSLNETENLYSNLTRKYDDLLQELNKINLEKHGLIRNLNHRISAEVAIVKDLEILS